MICVFLFQASKMGLTGTHPSGLPFFCSNGDHLTQPPPAHMGIPPYGALDAGKAAAAAGMYLFSAPNVDYQTLGIVLRPRGCDKY